MKVIALVVGVFIFIYTLTVWMYSLNELFEEFIRETNDMWKMWIDDILSLFKGEQVNECNINCCRHCYNNLFITNNYYRCFVGVISVIRTF